MSSDSDMSDIVLLSDSQETNEQRNISPINTSSVDNEVVLEEPTNTMVRGEIIDEELSEGEIGYDNTIELQYNEENGSNPQKIQNIQFIQHIHHHHHNNDDTTAIGTSTNPISIGDSVIDSDSAPDSIPPNTITTTNTHNLSNPIIQYLMQTIETQNNRISRLENELRDYRENRPRVRSRERNNSPIRTRSMTRSRSRRNKIVQLDNNSSYDDDNNNNDHNDSDSSHTSDVDVEFDNEIIYVSSDSYEPQDDDNSIQSEHGPYSTTDTEYEE